MKIASHNESTIDYPGKFGQIIFLKGCNFRCGYCKNFELNDAEEKVNEDSLLRELGIRSKSGWYQGVCICGGEPTIHKELPGFIEKLKGIGLSVKVDTNGSNPEMLGLFLDKGIVDYVAMDVKGKKEDYQKITGSEIDVNKIEESISLVKKFPKYEFRTTVLPFFTEEDLEDIGKWISDDGKNKPGLYTLQQFSNEKNFDAEYSKMKPVSLEKLKKFADIMRKYCEKVRVLENNVN